MGKERAVSCTVARAAVSKVSHMHLAALTSSWLATVQQLFQDAHRPLPDTPIHRASPPRGAPALLGHPP